MTVASFWEAAAEVSEEAAFGAIWRAIKAGHMSADPINIGGFAIHPTKPMLRVFPAEPSDTPETAVHAIQVAALDGEVKSLKDLLDEAKSNLEELREWRERTDRRLTDRRTPWWRRLALGVLA